MTVDNPIIVITGNEPMPVFAKPEIVAPRTVLVGGLSQRMFGAVLTAGLISELSDNFHEPDLDWMGPDPVETCDEYGPVSDCKQDHGERTNYKLKDQPFYMRGRNGKMRGY